MEKVLLLFEAMQYKPSMLDSLSSYFVAPDEVSLVI